MFSQLLYGDQITAGWGFGWRAELEGGIRDAYFESEDIGKSI
jgi:hypothetical protein